MAIVVFFDSVQNMPAEKYFEVLRRLEAAGAGAPKGRLSHVMFLKDGRSNVIDVFDTPENFQAFGETLVPLLQELAVDAGEPAVVPAANFIKG